jgi:hypothetical protein
MNAVYRSGFSSEAQDDGLVNAPSGIKDQALAGLCHSPAGIPPVLILAPDIL